MITQTSLKDIKAENFACEESRDALTGVAIYNQAIVKINKSTGQSFAKKCLK